jgi:hypothetical protein
MASAHELWRLHNRSGSALICRVRPAPDGYLVTVTRGDEDIETELYRMFHDAMARADAMRTRFIAEGWTGVSQRGSSEPSAW